MNAQQINPRVPPPPPDSPATAPPASAHASAPASSAAPAKPIDPSVPPPPPPAEDVASDAAAAPSEPVFDPLHAQRSLDIGIFYLRKGVYDAAIDRLIESSNYQPGVATPWKFLGEAYEKKHEYSKAADAYNKYLRMLPKAPDAEHIKKLISDLEEKSAQDSTKKE